MLKHCMLALVLTGLIHTVTPSVAQNGGYGQQSPSPGGAPEHGGHFDPATRAEMMARHLNLSSDQQAKVLEILKSAQSQLENLRSESGPQQERRTKMMEIHKSADDQIRAILDPAQQKKWDAMQSRREGHGGPGGQPQGPGSSEQK